MKQCHFSMCRLCSQWSFQSCITSAFNASLKGIQIKTSGSIHACFAPCKVGLHFALRALCYWQPPEGETSCLFVCVLLLHLSFRGEVRLTWLRLCGTKKISLNHFKPQAWISWGWQMQAYWRATVSSHERGREKLRPFISLVLLRLVWQL